MDFVLSNKNHHNLLYAPVYKYRYLRIMGRVLIAWASNDGSACAYAQSRQSLCYSHTQSVEHARIQKVLSGGVPPFFLGEGREDPNTTKSGPSSALQ